MYAAELAIKSKADSAQARDLLFELTVEYLTAMARHGQVCGEPVLRWSNGGLRATLYLARPDAFRPRFHSMEGGQRLKLLRSRCTAAPRWELCDDSAKRRSRCPDVSAVDALYLFTHMLDPSSPVCVGATGEPIPTYMLPLRDHEIDRINCWAEHYRMNDRMWMENGELELDAYGQIAEVDSDLSREGRELCALIETSVKSPTYYYLQRYWGYPDLQREHDRRCPECDGAWGCRITDRQGLGSYEFRCRSCRLISSRGLMPAEARYARIGEHSGNGKTKRS